MDNMNKRTLGLKKVGSSQYSNPERKIVIISDPGAVLRVELIELSPAEERSLTTDVRIGGNPSPSTKNTSQTNNK